jgi:hypothetical protein
MDKQYILSEIKRTAAGNGGQPPGWRRFAAETGIRQTDWSKHWARWGEAIREAGLAPNQFTAAYDTSKLLDLYAELARQIGRLPAWSDLKVKAHSDPDFPSEKTFRRFRSKQDLVSQLLTHCRSKGDYDDVIGLCESYVPQRHNLAADEEPSDASPDTPGFGFVYLLKSGRFYKIGRSNAAGRREYELAIQLPEKAITVHAIRTDDPSGIEAYWHKRFEDKRKNGEWFDLSSADVKAFKRRKFM